jgi:hypothetical protein
MNIVYIQWLTKPSLSESITWISLPFIERFNLSVRQHVAAVGRRVTTLCKDEDGL